MADKPKPNLSATEMLQRQAEHEQRVRAARSAMFNEMLKDAQRG